MITVKTRPLPLASSLLLVIAAGVLNIDLFEIDARGSDGLGSLYRLELVLDNSEPVSRTTSVNYHASYREEVKAATDRYPTYSAVLYLLTVSAKDHPCKAPSFRSSFHARAFTIPHQNSDEDETSPCVC